MSKLFWWVRQSILVILACFFLLFGIKVLISAYHLNDPYLFIMTFFSSNLIILISGVILFAFVRQMIVYYRGEEDESDTLNNSSSNGGK